MSRGDETISAKNGAIMNKRELLKIAKSHHIFDAGLSMTELIRRIQLAEGNFDCFGRASARTCDQSNCAWLDSCIRASASAGVGPASEPNRPSDPS